MTTFGIRNLVAAMADRISPGYSASVPRADAGLDLTPTDVGLNGEGLAALLEGRPGKKEAAALRSMKTLVEWGGGRMRDGIFVVKPGVKVLAATQLMPAGAALLADLNSDRDEFLARFSHATLLFAGVTIETSLELIAHGVDVARLTSSKTSAMNFPAYRIVGDDPGIQDAQILYTKAVLLLRSIFENHFQPRKLWGSGTEIQNRMAPAHKATVLTYSLPLKRLDWILKGRLPKEGNEEELREVAAIVARELSERYPGAIRAPEEYERAGQSSRYAKGTEPETSRTDAGIRRKLFTATGGIADEQGRVTKIGVKLIARTRHEEHAGELFDNLHVDRTQPEFDQTVEFNSRLTYLSFNEERKSAADFNLKMIRELQHLSVAASNRATFMIAGLPAETRETLKQWDEFAESLFKSHAMPGETDDLVFTINLRMAHQFLLRYLSPAWRGTPLQEIASEMYGQLRADYALIIREREFYEK